MLNMLLMLLKSKQQIFSVNIIALNGFLYSLKHLVCLMSSDYRLNIQQLTIKIGKYLTTPLVHCCEMMRLNVASFHF